MGRSTWKIPFYSRINKQNVWCRSCMVLPQDIGKQYNIYNGKGWVLRKIVESMVGHKFGEFSVTKKKVIHKNSKKRQMSKVSERKSHQVRKK